MPKDEFIKWISYLNNKSPTIQEQQLAVLSTIVNNALGGKAKVHDFILSKMPKKESQTFSVESMRGLLGGLTNPS